MTAELVPISQREARAFVAAHHRHNGPHRGDVIRVGLQRDGELVAVAAAGRPVAPALQDGRSLEVTRVCVGPVTRNACSMLYGALCRAAAALGYQRMWTYTLESESGASPRAAGFVLDAVIEARSWAIESGRPHYDENLLGERISADERKLRWRREL
jgi:hypothetical protein